MSTYAEVLQVLTTERVLDPTDAVQLLARLRQETGEDLAAAAEKQLDGRFRREPGMTEVTFRNRKRVYAASMRVLQVIRQLSAAPHPLPNPRNRRSHP
ncbi:hypothetical protein [Streptomyces sp. NPDC096142]|uniref:hypothetical protein n=1 Tax=Streptomyces sp. NPDC096142 TaxID=3366077 RepID=UPI003818EB31